jgi:hypothetical protein
MKIFKLSLLVICGLSFACTKYNAGENYGKLYYSKQSLVLTKEEHSIGWEKEKCFLCHNIENIHLDRADNEVDFNEIRNMVKEDGESICTKCHGNNGVE